MGRADPRKVAVAFCIRKLTPVSNGWLAEKLHMKSAANVSQQVRRFKLRQTAKALPVALRAWIEALEIRDPLSKNAA